MIRTARWLLPLLLLAGCMSTDGADPLPSPPPTSALAAPAKCAVASVAVGEASTTEQMFTNVVRRTSTEGSVSETELVSQTFTPSLTWESSPAPDDDDVFAAIAEQADPVDFPSDAPQDSSAALSTMLQGLDGPAGSTTVGYTSILTTDYAVTVPCEGDGTAQGTLSTWSDHETGVVDCEVQPPRSASAARAAYDEYCGPE